MNYVTIYSDIVALLWQEKHDFQKDNQGEIGNSDDRDDSGRVLPLTTTEIITMR